MSERESRKFDPRRAAGLDAPERDLYLPSGQLIGLLELDGGETLLDYGAGTGRLTLAAAAALPRGRVIAIEESPEMLGHLRERTADMPNVETMLIAGNHVPLADGFAQRILAVNLLHEVRGENALTEMHRLLAADGLLVLVDWERGRPRPVGPPADELLYTAEEALAELHRAGFDCVEVPAGLPYHFAIRAERARPPAAEPGGPDKPVSREVTR